MTPVRKYIDDYLLNSNGTLYRDYYHTLVDEGYVPVEISGKNRGPSLHEWTMENIGWENFNWIGRTYWFNNERDAIMFALRWSS